MDEREKDAKEILELARAHDITFRFASGGDGYSYSSLGDIVVRPDATLAEIRRRVEDVIAEQGDALLLWKLSRLPV